MDQNPNFKLELIVKSGTRDYAQLISSVVVLCYSSIFL